MSKKIKEVPVNDPSHGVYLFESKVKPPAGCYLGWEGCTNTADIQVGDAWVCMSCARKMAVGE